jgi:GT2 family glycosyltransferase
VKNHYEFINLKMNETVYILLPVHNRRAITGRFITCLAEQTYRKHHLVLIDDGSTDGTAQMVQERVSSLTVLTGSGDWWWGGALHEGYKWLRTQEPPFTDIVLIINDDTEFGEDLLESAVSFLREREKTFLLAQCYNKDDNAFIDAGVHVNWKRFSFEQPSPEKPVNCLSTRGLFYRVGDFFSVGGFRPRLLPHYLSDYEFTIRAHRKGMSLVTDPSVKVRLDVSTTGVHGIGDRSFGAAMRTVFSTKSAINPVALAIFVALACPWRWKLNCWLRIASRSLSHAWALLMKQAQTR